jgi:sulfatase maturation enzyme AslB (radical SAM superfamily)
MKKLAKFERVDAEFNNFLHLIYYIYGGCKFNCKYCFTINNKKRDVNLKDQYQIVDTFFKLTRPFDVYFYGGEPTEYKDLTTVIEYILSKTSTQFRRMELQTNLSESYTYYNNLCEYDNLIISPSIHLTFLKGDNIDSLIKKLDLIYSYDKLERIDFMLEKWNVDEHYKFYNILKDKPYFDRVMCTFNYMEINKKDNYTGNYNTLDLYKDIVSESTYQERYKLTYDDGTNEEVDISDLYTRNINFKGWNCDAGKYLMYVEYNGDWWVCDTKNIKEPPMGNLLKQPSRFLLQNKIPFNCSVDKCDGCYYIKKEK